MENEIGNEINISKSTLKIKEMSEDDKPREKALAQGVDKLTVAELIAIALGSGLQGKSVLDVSRELLAAVDNDPGRLARLTPQRLIKDFKGIGPAKAVQLMAAIELGMRVSSSVAFKSLIDVCSAADVANYMRSRLRIDHEEMWLLMLDRRNRVRHVEMLSKGGMNATMVDPKMVFTMALDHKASAIIMVHNHPSGNCRPSVNDDNLTRRINDGGKLLDIRLLDHVIVTDETYYSYADNGKI